MQLEADTPVRAVSDCVACSFEEGIALLDTRTNSYFTLNSVGQFIWSEIQVPISFAQVVARVCDVFDVDPALCQSDVRRLLTDLESKQLVQLG